MGTLTLDVAKLKEVRRILEWLTATVVSNGNLHRDDKIAIHGRIKRAKTILDNELQLDMFSASQRVR